MWDDADDADDEAGETGETADLDDVQGEAQRVLTQTSRTYTRHDTPRECLKYVRRTSLSGGPYVTAVNI